MGEAVPEGEGRGLRVLLVEDDGSSRLVLSVLLEEEGFRVDVASSFAEAQGALVRSDADHELVLLDQHLGDGIGTDLVPAIRARLPQARVVIVSGSAEEKEAALAGCDAVVPKGVSFPDLMARLTQVLRAPR